MHATSTLLLLLPPRLLLPGLLLLPTPASVASWLLTWRTTHATINALQRRTHHTLGCFHSNRAFLRFREGTRLMFSELVAQNWGQPLDKVEKQRVYVWR